MENRGTILMEKYELGRLLGKGTFAKVHHARNIANGHSVAIKIFDKEKIMKVGLVEQIKREISIMRMVKHPNIVRLFEVMASKSKIYFVLEYAKGGELFQKIANGKLQEDVVHKYFQQLISAVDYCHSRGAYHRDLKPENLLLDDDENLKVTDFGLSALADSRRQDGLLHTTCGTPAYVAPEVISRTGYDGAKADIWSCGVILFVLMAGYLPFHDSNLMDMYKKIEKGHFKCPRWFPSDVRKLIYKILDPNPITRISIEKIKESKWFKKGYVDKSSKTGADTKVHVPGDVTATFDSSSSGISEVKRESNGVITTLNAFDIISLSAGFDLSGLLEECNHRKAAHFSSRRSASTIIWKFERMAKHLKLKIKKKEGGVLKIEGVKEGRKGVLSIDAEIYQVAPSFHFVEIKKTNGDTIEYEKVLQEGIRPALKDIIWTWQGDEQPTQLQ